MTNIEKLIKAAMADLQKNHQNFGISKSGDGRAEKDTLEDAFQEALCTTLNQMSQHTEWRWVREVSYATTSLRNDKRIYVDILGIHPHYHSVAIELKYVTRTTDDKGCIGKPSDIYSFPYDVLKDCLKLEIAASSTQDMGETFNPLPNIGEHRYKPIGLGVVIGLSNEALYWSPDCLLHRRGTGFAWALNYLKAIHPKPDETVVLKNKVITTCSAKSNEPTANAVYRQKRHHLSLGRVWNGAWLHYAAQKIDNPFKYLMLTSDFQSQSQNYSHNWNNPSTLPFGSEKMKFTAIEIAERDEYSGVPIMPV